MQVFSARAAYVSSEGSTTWIQDREPGRSGALEAGFHSRVVAGDHRVEQHRRRAFQDR